MYSRILLFVFGAVVVGTLVNADAQPPPPPVVDERWNVTVNGQTIRVDGDGSFRLPNIAAADFFGATGPGSAPDFKSDEWFQVVGTATIDGVTWYAYSEPFQIEANQSGSITYSVLTLPVTRRAPADIPESIAIEVVTALQDDTLYIDSVGGPGSSPIRVWANFAGVDDPREVTSGGGTTYRTSNRRVVDVAESGGQVVVTARGIGTGFVTATNRGATAVQRFVVTTPCVDTLLVGRVVDSGGFPMQGAIVRTEGGSNSPTGTNASGEFSFNVCYTPGTSFSVVVVGPTAGQKAVLTDIAAVPDGVTDVGTITLESNLVFWNLNGMGTWGSPAGSASTNWHTGSVPTAASHVFVNIEDRVSVPVNPYTVNMPVPNVTVSSLTLDSPHATLTTIYPGFQFTVTDTARFLDGLVEWRIAGWQGGTFINDAEVRFFGPCSMVGGLDFVNNGLTRVEFDGNNGSLTVRGSGTTFTQASTLDDLFLEGEMHIRQAATLTTTPNCKGITIGTSGLLDIRESSGGVPSVFNHNGGTITLNNSPPAQGNGLKVEDWGTLNVNGGVIDVSPTGSLEVRGSPTVVNLNGGTVNHRGVFRVDGPPGCFLTCPDLLLNGTTIIGVGADGNGVILDKGSLTIGPQATSPAKFTFFHHGNDLTGAIGSEHTIIIQGFGNTFDGDASVTAVPDAANTFTNNGLIRFATLQAGEYGTYTHLGLSGNQNALVNNNRIEVLFGDGSWTDIVTKFLENYGTITLSGETQFEPSSGMYRNRGTLVVTSAGTLNLDAGVPTIEQIAGSMTIAPELGCVLRAGATFRFLGGTMDQGQVVVQNGTIVLGAAATNRAQFLIWGTTTLQGEIGWSHTVTVEGGNRGQGSATLLTSSATTLTNRGALTVATPDANNGASIQLSQSQQLVNEVGATFDVNAGAGTNPFIGAALRNKGTTNIRRSLTLGNNNDTHQNQTTGVFNLFNNAVVTFQGNAATPFTNAADAQSTGIVGGIGLLNVGSGRTFQNGGRVEPGGDAAAGTLTVTGNYTQASGGTLDIELGGTGAGQYDKLAVSQQATLAGTMNVSLLPGYIPVLGQTFDVVTYASRSGTFAMIALPPLGGGLTWQTSFTATSLRLSVLGSLSNRPASNGKPASRPAPRP